MPLPFSVGVAKKPGPHGLTSVRICNPIRFSSPAEYLLTSTSLALVSFSLCYAAVSNGVDVSSLLQKVGIEVSSTSETAGTVGLAYAIHKAASPIRFPPTVALTPVVAKTLFGKDGPDEAESSGTD